MEEPDNYGEVASLVIGREDDGIFVFGRHHDEGRRDCELCRM